MAGKVTTRNFISVCLCVSVALVTAARAEALLTEEQALKLVLPKAKSYEPQTRQLTEAQREELQKQTGLRFPQPQYQFFVGRDNGQVAGYAVVMNEIGKHEYITFMVGMSPRLEITDVAVMVYRETRGWEVKEQRFLRQFHGKRVSDPIQVNRDIVNYTGATLSSHAIARGVKKALVLAGLFYGH